MTRSVRIARVVDRKADLATIHCLQKELGLSKADSEALKLAITQRSSSADMNNAQRSQYIGHLRTLKERMVPKPIYTAARPPVARSVDDQGDERWSKARALWTLLAQAGQVRADTDAALLVYVKRQTKLEAWRFLRACSRSP